MVRLVASCFSPWHRWTVQLRILVVLSGAELRLASSVWPAPQDEAVVSEIIGRVLGALLGQGEQVAEGKRAPAKVFVLLDMIRNLGVSGGGGYHRGSGSLEVNVSS
jgi:hypothetical protein